jgi:hypothetical protein
MSLRAAKSSHELGLAGRIAQVLIDSKLTPLVHHHFHPARRRRHIHAAAGGRAADQSPDDRRACFNARL